MTSFYVETRMSQLCPKEPHVLSQYTPILGCPGTLFSDSLNCKKTVNKSKCIQDPRALQILKCRYYIDVQTRVPGIYNRNICSKMCFFVPVSPGLPYTSSLKN